MVKKFRIQTGLHVPNSGGRCSVRIRVCAQGRIDLYTGITLTEKQWSSSRRRVKQGCVVDGYMYNQLNDLIDEQEKFVTDYFVTAATRSVEPSLRDLQKRFNRQFKGGVEAKSGEFFQAFDDFRMQQEKARAWKKDMVDVFARLEEKLRAFNPRISFQDLSVETMDAFMRYLSQSMYNDTILKNLSYLKQFVTWAQKRKYPIHEEYFTFEPRLQTAQKAVRYLTKEELNTIYGLDLSGNEPLERTRDFFVFSCLTSLRFSDLKALRHDNIVMNEAGDYYLDLVTEKDEDKVHYKLASRAVEIYKKYKDYLLEDNLVFPVLSNQKYNKYLKVLGKTAGLKGVWKDEEFRLDKKEIVLIPKNELSSHTARRTFVVLAYNSGVPLERIAMITSHSDVSKMKPYLQVLTQSTDKVIEAIDEIIK